MSFCSTLFSPFGSQAYNTIVFNLHGSLFANKDFPIVNTGTIPYWKPVGLKLLNFSLIYVTFLIFLSSHFSLSPTLPVVSKRGSSTFSRSTPRSLRGIPPIETEHNYDHSVIELNHKPESIEFMDHLDILDGIVVLPGTISLLDIFHWCSRSHSVCCRALFHSILCNVSFWNLWFNRTKAPKAHIHEMPRIIKELHRLISNVDSHKCIKNCRMGNSAYRVYRSLYFCYIVIPSENCGAVCKTTFCAANKRVKLFRITSLCACFDLFYKRERICMR